MEAKDNKIEELALENKALEKVNRNQEKELDVFHDAEELEKKVYLKLYVNLFGQVNVYNDEIACLKEQINNIKSENIHNEQNYKKQQIHIALMLHKYKLVSDKIMVIEAKQGRLEPIKTSTPLIKVEVGSHKKIKEISSLNLNLSQLVNLISKHLINIH